MTPSQKPRYRTSEETGLQPHYRTRISVGGCLIITASWDAPSRMSNGVWAANWISDPAYDSDTILFIDWSAVSSVTCQFVP